MKGALVEVGGAIDLHRHPSTTIDEGPMPA
jgi:hypothetical protein